MSVEIIRENQTYMLETNHLAKLLASYHENSDELWAVYVMVDNRIEYSAFDSSLVQAESEMRNKLQALQAKLKRDLVVINTALGQLNEEKEK